MKRRFSDLRRVMWKNALSIFLFDIQFKLFSVALVVHAARSGIGFALKRTGFSYLTMENALRFFLSPISLVVALFPILLFLVLGAIEMSCLHTAFQASMSGQHISVANIFLAGTKNAWELLTTKNQKVLLLMAIYYLLTGSWIFEKLILHTRPLSYIFLELAPFVWVRIAAAVLLALLAFWTIRRCFVPALAILRPGSYRDNARESSALFRKHPWTALLVFAAANASVIVFYRFHALVLKSLSTLIIMLIADRTRELALVLLVSDYMDVTALILTAVFSVTLNVGLGIFLQHRFSKNHYLMEIPIFRQLLPEKLRKRISWLAAAGLVALGFFYLFDGIYAGGVSGKSISSDIQITSHRGFSMQAPENTLPALEAAIESLADYVEIDVQETKDGELVIFHDRNLKRIAGNGRKIKDFTYAELQVMDFGAWFSDEYKETRILTLAQALETCKGRINMNIELKSDGPFLAEKTMALIEAFGMQDQVIISSMNYKQLRQVKAIDENMTTGYILSGAYGSFYDDANVDFFSIRSSFVTPQLVKSAHIYGKQIHAWTVNSKAELLRLKQLNIDNIITDQPVLAREMIYREKDTESLLEFFHLALKAR